MDEIEELRGGLDRLSAALDDLVVRGVRSAGAQDLGRLSALRDEMRASGAEHLSGRLSALVDAVAAGDRGAAAALMRALTSLRLFERMLTQEVAARSLAAGEATDESDDEEDGPDAEDE